MTDIIMNELNQEDITTIVIVCFLFASMLPTFALFSFHIYKKYGVFRTKFSSNRLFIFEDEFIEFIKQNSFYCILGFLLIVVVEIVFFVLLFLL